MHGNKNIIEMIKNLNVYMTPIDGFMVSIGTVIAAIEF